MDESNTNLNTIQPQNPQQLNPNSHVAHTLNNSDDITQMKNSIKLDIKTLPTNTIAPDDVANIDLRVSSAHQLSEVPVKYSLSPLEVLAAIKDHVFENHQKTSDSIPGQASEDENEGQLQSSDPSLPEVSAPSATQSISSITSPSQQNLSITDNKLLATVDHVFQNQQKILDGIPCKAAEVENESQLQSNDPSLPEVSAPSVTQSMSSITSPRQQNLSVADNKGLVSVLYKETQNSFRRKSLSIVPVSKKSSPDGYNWRKYGQKQVKSPEGSRSYYRCTHCDCYAKKIECSDYTNRVIDTVYRSQHNHDPPNKLSCSPESRPPHVNGHSKTENSSTGPNDAVPSTILETYAEQRAPTSVSKEQCTDGSDEKSEINVDEDSNEAETRKGLKNKSDPNSFEALSKSGKKPKLVVHAAGDVVISGDGFRWRKYGQKMVKGNPHPRNYYRCTSAGCPVRKHIEKAMDDPIAAIITYKGVHDHDMPVPRKHQGLPSPIISSTTGGGPVPVSSFRGNLCEQLQNQISTTKWSVDEVKSDASELGSSMEVPSARTLVSVGFEIKPC